MASRYNNPNILRRIFMWYQRKILKMINSNIITNLSTSVQQQQQQWKKCFSKRRAISREAMYCNILENLLWLFMKCEFGSRIIFWSWLKTVHFYTTHIQKYAYYHHSIESIPRRLLSSVGLKFCEFCFLFYLTSDRKRC